MRTILFALLLATQVAFSQVKPMVDPCDNNDLPWGSDIKTAAIHAETVGYTLFDMSEEDKSDIMYLTYTGPKYTVIYSFLSGKNIGRVVVLMEESVSKRKAKVAEQVQLYMKDAPKITGSNSFQYTCKGQEIMVKVSEGTSATMIILTNATLASEIKAKSK